MWVIFGTGSLGIVIGWLVWTFVKRAETLTVQAVGAIASIVAGGGVLALWKQTGTGALTSEANSFFIGLVTAIVYLGALDHRIQPPTDPPA